MKKVLLAAFSGLALFLNTAAFAENDSEVKSENSSENADEVYQSTPAENNPAQADVQSSRKSREPASATDNRSSEKDSCSANGTK